MIIALGTSAGRCWSTVKLESIFTQNVQKLVSERVDVLLDLIDIILRNSLSLLPCPLYECHVSLDQIPHHELIVGFALTDRFQNLLELKENP